MATKDYVTRSRKPKPKKKPVKSVPWIRILIALLLISGFIYALYLLSSVQNGAKAPEQNTEQSSGKVTDPNNGNSDDLDNKSTVKLDDLPILEDEEYDYIDSLPNYDVEVDVDGPKQINGDFIMQCGSFRTSERANELKAMIAMQGFESRVLTSNNKNGLWHRVVLGPYERKRQAERDRHQLKRANINNCKIWLTSK